jgi:hypothetical protein
MGSVPIEVIILGVAVAIALLVVWRRDRSGALDDVGPMPGIGKSDKGPRDGPGMRDG